MAAEIGELRAGAPTRHAATPAPLCPRCDYDQSGHVATWTDSCPLWGRCTECGLDFPWSNILGESARVAWFCETRDVPSELRYGPVRRWLITSLRAMRPRRFWRAIDLATPMHRRSLIRFVVGWVLAIHLLASLCTLGSAAPYLVSQWTWLSWAELVNVVMSTLMPFRQVARVFYYAIPVWWMLMVPLVVNGLTCVVFLTLGETLGRAKVRRRHILRGVCYAAPWSVLTSLVMPGMMLMFAVAADFRLFPWLYNSSALEITSFVSSVPWLVGMVWWWRCFARDYLRINHTWGVALVAVGVAILISLVIVVLLWPVIYRPMFLW